jgi:hypothetical protein
MLTKFGRTDPDSSRLREMIQNSYETLTFPGDWDHFGDLAIYVRRTAMSAAME